MADSPARRGAAPRPLLKLCPWLILALTLGVTWSMWDHERQTSRRALGTQFGFALRDTVSRIDQGVMSYELILSGLQSLFATTDLHDHVAVDQYVGSLNLGANFAGIHSIGIVEWLPAQRRAALLDARMDSRARPIGDRGGGDIWLDPALRVALEKARDSGMAAISGKLLFKTDAQASGTPGFIMYLPVYARGEAHDGVETRRAHLIGWVYAAFHFDAFMASLYGSDYPGLSLALYDGTRPLEEALLFRRDGPEAAAGPKKTARVGADEYLVVGGHSWMLSMGTRREFEARFGSGNETTIAASGALLSLLLALVAWMIISGHDRSLLLAENREKNERLNVVLKEVHHRVKNNMNTIISLLSLQAASLEDPTAIAALEDAGKRMQSMGLLYDKLYQSSDFSRLSLKVYLPALIDEIMETFSGIASVQVDKRIDDIVLEARRIQPLGMLMNELLTNIMKYAFQGREGGTIMVSAAAADGRVVICVEDNGRGMPESVSFERSTGFGMILVKALTAQLDGRIRIERGDGTRIVLEFRP